MNKGRHKILIIILLLSLMIAAYANSLNNKFVWDDIDLVKKNIFIRDFKYLPQVFSSSLFMGSGVKTNFYRPVQNLSLMFDYAIWRLNPLGYHLTNVILHFLNTILIFFLINAVSDNIIVSAAAAGFFAIHPVHTEAVSYISGRADLLYSFFSLSSLLLFIKSIKTNFSKKRFIFILGVLILFIFALLSKEGAIILPFIFLLYIFSFLKDYAQKKIGLQIFIMSILILFIYLILRATALNFSSGTIPFLKIPLFMRSMIGCIVFISYLLILIFPFNLRMERTYQLFIPSFRFQFLISFLVLAILFAMAIKNRQRSKLLTFGSMWFLLNLIPVSNLFPLNAFMAEHWLYLPSVGFFTVFAVGVDKAIRKTNLRKWLIPGLILLIIFYSFLTLRQNRIWKNSFTLYKYTLKFSPNNSRLHNNLGLAYYDEGSYEEAKKEFNKAIKLDPDNASAYLNLGNVYFKEDNIQGALEKYNQAASLNPSLVNAYNKLGIIYNKTGEHLKAIDVFKRSIALQPFDAKIWSYLAEVYTAIGSFDEAIKAYQRSLKLAPAFSDAHLNLGALYAKTGDLNKAITEYEIAKRINPESAMAYLNLGLAYLNLDNLVLAKDNFIKALTLDPSLEQARRNLEKIQEKGGRILK